MKKTLAAILSVIMLIACISVSVSASVGVEDYTSASDIIAPNTENVSVTTYDADGFVLDKYEKIIDEETGAETLIFYGFNDDGELIPMSENVITEDENGRLLSSKNYEYDEESKKLILLSETVVAYDGLRVYYDSVSYDRDGNIIHRGYIDDENDEQGRNIFSHMVSVDENGEVVFDMTYDYTYDDDTNTIWTRTTDRTVDPDEVFYDMAETIFEDNTVIEILSESEDGFNYTPFEKTVTVRESALKETVSVYDYENGEWVLVSENSYEYDKEGRESLWVYELSDGKITHKFSPDGKTAVHTFFFFDEETGEYVECEKAEETFIDAYRRSTVKRFYMEDKEWKSEIEYIFEYDDKNSYYKVSAYTVNADGEKCLSEYAIVEYRYIPKPISYNPPTGDLASVAVTLISFATIGGTTLITRRKSR